MKMIGRILIIAGVAWLIVMGMNWLRANNLLPVNQGALPAAGFSEREQGAAFWRPERGAGFVRPEDGPFGERGDHHSEGPSLAGATEMVGTLIKIGLITLIVVVIDQVARFAKRRQRQRAAPA
ncbi:hypothetical protein [Chloroflexus sp.]|uniref:hypothetical protein n=1 Tax=Chloroflexus sp. TaxID=1904827 RepID=UPI002ACE1B4B|nr:hypothetical protein [Chloroflexus sp.]